MTLPTERAAVVVAVAAVAVVVAAVAVVVAAVAVVEPSDEVTIIDSKN